MHTGIDAYHLALDTTWDWAERRGVRVDFWRRDVDEWQVEVTLADSDGDFTGSTALQLFHPKRSTRRPKVTQAQMKDDYIDGVRTALDAAVTEARERRGRWQRRRLSAELEKGIA